MGQSQWDWMLGRKKSILTGFSLEQFILLLM
jgi:hypothetical protein